MDHAKGAAALAGAGRARQGLVVLAVAAARRVAAVGGEAAKLAAGALAHGRVQGEKVAAVRRAARACPRAKLVAFKAALLLGALVAGQLLEWDEDVLARRLAGGRAAVDLRTVTLPFCSCVYVGLAKTASAPPIQILETISSQYVHDAGRLPPSDPRII